MNNIKLYENKDLVGFNILLSIRKAGHTIISISKKVNLEKEAIRKFINGEINNIDEFSNILFKLSSVLNVQNISDLLLNYDKFLIHKAELDNIRCISENTKEMYYILEDIIHLCEIYY